MLPHWIMMSQGFALALITARHKQNRRDPTVAGSLVIRGELAPIWPILLICTRCHVGRHVVEGLGAIGLKLI